MVVVVAAAAAAAVVVVVVDVVRGGKLAFGCFGAHAFVSPKGSAGAACVCRACLKIWRGSVCA